MKFIQGHNRTQINLFPVSLDQSIDPENEVRMIDLSYLPAGRLLIVLKDGYFQEAHLQNITKEIVETMKRRSTSINVARQLLNIIMVH